MPFIRSVSGLRATTADCLPEETIKKYVSAFHQVCPPGAIAVGRDGRPSGERIGEVIINELVRLGRHVHLLGVVPTPTVQLFAERIGCAGGIAVTASHNPSEWNGLKFVNSDGVFLNKEENVRLWSIVDSDASELDESDGGRVEAVDDPIGQHIQKIFDIGLFPESALNRIAEMQLRAVVDAVNSSGSVAVPRLLQRLGIETIELFCDGSGNFPHTPEPLPQNLSELAERTKAEKADFGIAVDPDADRLVLIDETGNPIGEEKTISIAVESVLSSDKYSGKKNAVVVNHSTTRLVEDIAAKYSADAFRSAVGEINVVEKMKATKSVIGGEGSGGVILPDCHYGRDSLVGIALLADLIRRTGLKLSEIASRFPSYEMVKLKKEFHGDINRIIEVVKSKFPGDELNLEDGIKVIRPRSWAQLRTSNTEPIVRAIAEAPTREEAAVLAQSLLDLC